MIRALAQQAKVIRLSTLQGLRLIEYRGDAMIGAYILPHSRLLVDFSREPQNGDVVVVLKDDKFTVRFYKCNEYNQWLVAANRRYADMIIAGADITLGVVIKVVTDSTLLRDFMF